MVLADTSIWVDHWRRGNADLARLLDDDQIVVHPFVIGELSLGALHPRAAVLADLRSLRPTPLADDAEVASLVERRRLWGQGLGWIDAHLLASALLAACQLWTLDKPLAKAARRLEVGWEVA